MYLATRQDVTCQEYLTVDTRAREVDVNELLKESWSRLCEKALRVPMASQIQVALSLFDTDLSSVYPSFQVSSETTSMLSHLDDDELKKILEYDVFVPMPPRREYAIDMRIASIARAKPMSVDPEQF